MAVRVLREHRVAFVPHLYAWQPHGGTRASAEALGVDEHAVIKTLIFEDETRAPLCILMHGDREVSTKNLARQIGKKSVAPCRPETADKHSGYQVGGTSPFGLRRHLFRALDRRAATDLFERRSARLSRRDYAERARAGAEPQARGCRHPLRRVSA